MLTEETLLSKLKQIFDCPELEDDTVLQDLDTWDSLSFMALVDYLQSEHIDCKLRELFTAVTTRDLLDQILGKQV